MFFDLYTAVLTSVQKLKIKYFFIYNFFRKNEKMEKALLFLNADIQHN